MKKTELHSVHAPGGVREVLKLATPLLISMGSHVMMQFSDRVFLAWSSPVYLQAAMPAGILAFTLTCWFMELAGYSNTFVAQHHGAGNKALCAKSTGQGLILAVATWIPLLLLIVPGMALLRHSGHPPAAIEQELIYFKILMLGSVSLPLYSAAASFFTGRGDTVTTMYATIIANAVNIVLDYALIFGKFGFPEMGIRGAAWATVIAGFISPLILIGLFYGKRYRVEYKTLSALRPDFPLLRKLLKYGIPSATQLLLDISAFSVFVMLAGTMGERSLTASNAAFSVNHIVFMPLLGFGIAASTLVGKYQGMRKPELAYKSALTAWKLGSIYMLAFALSFVLLPEFYFSFFTKWGKGSIDVQDILPLGRIFLIMMAVWGLFDATALILSGALKGAGDTKYVMYYSLGLAWGIWVPGQIIIAKVLKLGIIAHWAWLCLYMVLLSAGYAARFLRGKWKNIVMVGEHPADIPPLAGSASVDSPV